MTGQATEFEDSGHFESYKQFASQLRTWLVAYGIGAPVLFVSQPTISNALKMSGQGKTVIALFLGGVAAQIFYAWAYKTAMWYLYLGDINREFHGTKKYKWSYQVSKQFWTDLLADAISIAMFAVATYMALGAVIQ